MLIEVSVVRSGGIRASCNSNVVLGTLVGVSGEEKVVVGSPAKKSGPINQISGQILRHRYLDI